MIDDGFDYLVELSLFEICPPNYEFYPTVPPLPPIYATGNLDLVSTCSIARFTPI